MGGSLCLEFAGYSGSWVATLSCMVVPACCCTPLGWWCWDIEVLWLEWNSKLLSHGGLLVL